MTRRDTGRGTSRRTSGTGLQTCACAAVSLATGVLSVTGVRTQATDLTADDFALTVDGRPRRLVSAQFIAQARQFERPAPKDEIFSLVLDRMIARECVSLRPPTPAPAARRTRSSTSG